MKLGRNQRLLKICVMAKAFFTVNLLGNSSFKPFIFNEKICKAYTQMYLLIFFT